MQTSKGNQNWKIEGHTKLWTKETGQKDKQRSTKHHTENERSSNTNPTKSWGQRRCFEMVDSSCSVVLLRQHSCSVGFTYRLDRSKSRASHLGSLRPRCIICLTFTVIGLSCILCHSALYSLRNPSVIVLAQLHSSIVLSIWLYVDAP